MVFSKMKPEFLKTDKLVNLMSNATETVRFLKILEIGLFARKNGFSEKTLKFSKMARVIKFAVECNWKSKISQNVQTFGCYKTIIMVLQYSLNLIWIELGSFLKRFKENIYMSAINSSQILTSSFASLIHSIDFDCYYSHL